MWHELDPEAMAREAFVPAPERTPEEVEAIVVIVRLELYNRGMPCGAVALRERLREHVRLRPLPSVRRISRILTLYGLTYGRTGWYDGDAIDGLPVSARVPPDKRKHFSMIGNVQNA